MNRGNFFRSFYLVFLSRKRWKVTTEGVSTLWAQLQPKAQQFFEILLAPVWERWTSPSALTGWCLCMCHVLCWAVPVLQALCGACWAPPGASHHFPPLGWPWGWSRCLPPPAGSGSTSPPWGSGRAGVRPVWKGQRAEPGKEGERCHLQLHLFSFLGAWAGWQQVAWRKCPCWVSRLWWGAAVMPSAAWEAGPVRAATCDLPQLFTSRMLLRKLVMMGCC